MVTQFGFQSSELYSILQHLTRVEMIISVAFLVFGSVCPGYSNESRYQAVCHTNIVSALAGLLTCGLGILSMCRYRSKAFMVAFLLMSIISSSAFLMIIVTGGVWLSRLGEIEGDNGAMTTVTLILELFAVGGGVCYILTSAFICHRFAHKTMKYQILGSIRQPRGMVGGSEESLESTGPETSLLVPPDQMEMQTAQYHICTPRCRH